VDEGSLVFSIIIPTYNRPAMLAECLKSLTELDYPPRVFEVIVVDDGGPVSLRPVVESFEKEMQIILLRRENGGPAAARNSGIAVARGKYLAFTDDDCKPDPGWLKELEKHLVIESCLMVGGRTINVLLDNPYSCTSQLIVDIVYAHYNANPSMARFFASNNIAVPADAFRGIRGFNPLFRTSEDRDACDRWLANGYRMVYAPGAVIYHAHKLSLESFWKQHAAYGRGALRFNRAHSSRSRGDSTLSSDFYIELPGRLKKALSGVPAKRIPALLFLVATWFVANTFGFVSETVKYMRSKDA